MSSFFENGGVTPANVASITSLNNEATASKTAAATSATAAANSATLAANSATASATSANSITGSVTSAETAETNAETAETNALASKNAANSSAVAAASSETNAASSASTASGHATTSTNNASDAAKLATNAEDSQFTLADGSTTGYSALHWHAKAEDQKTAAAASATTASTQATNSSNSATASATSATTASNKAADAQKLAVNAEDSQFTLSDGSTTGYSALHYNAKAEDEKTAAASSATAAANSATAAASSATASSNSASTSSTQATNSSNSASSSATAQAASEAARDAALAALDSFDDRYLGVKSSAPTVDNDGNSLATGSLYYDSSSNSMKVYSGSAWLNAYASLSGALIATNNLSDLNNAGTARTNLGVAIGSNVQAHSSVLDGTQQSFTSALKTKLDGIAAAAGTADSVTIDKLNLISTSSAPSLEAKGDGSSQDGYIQLNCSQNSHGIKLKSPPHSANASYTLTFPTTDGSSNQFLQTDGSGELTWATETTYSVGDGGLTQNNFTDADHTKLNGIEASATADQTDAEIRAAVEAASDSNVFTDDDHSKLNAIEASADVTDATNVTAAGALMDSECTSLADVKALNQSLVTTSTAATFARLKLTQTTVAASGSATTLNFAAANNFLVNMSADTTFTWSNLSGAIGCSGNIVLQQDGTGGRDFTLPSEAKTPVNGATIVQNTGANEISVISYYVVSESIVLVNYLGDFA